MNKKQLIIMPLVFLLAVLVYVKLVSSNALSKDYETIRQEGEWNRLVLTYKGKSIYEITPKYIDRFEDVSYDDMWIELIYDRLVPRALHQKIVPFEDITGDGISDLVIRERPPAGTAYMPFVVRVLSINGDSVTEYPPIEGGGEVYYFTDFNKDGILEFVNTDSERHFTYDDTGMPISDYVWRFDIELNRYIRSSNK